MRKVIFTISTITRVAVHSTLFAQDAGNVKADKKTEVALAERYRRDQNFARTARSVTNNNLNWWIGQKLSDVIDVWGAPSRTVSDGADGQIVVYETFVSGTSGSYTPGALSWDGYGNITNYRAASDTRSSYSYTAYREVYIDKNNIIKKVKTGNR